MTGQKVMQDLFAILQNVGYPSSCLIVDIFSVVPILNI